MENYNYRLGEGKAREGKAREGKAREGAVDGSEIRARP
jgi:hypothetical protein